jgi:hypothetical protein
MTRSILSEFVLRTYMYSVILTTFQREDWFSAASGVSRVDGARCLPVSRSCLYQLLLLTCAKYLCRNRELLRAKCYYIHVEDLTDWSRLSRINTFIEEHSVANPTIYFSHKCLCFLAVQPAAHDWPMVGPSNTFLQSSNSKRSVLRFADLKREKQFFYKEIRESK